MYPYLLGDVGTGGAPSVDLQEYGPLSPEQLSKLDRVLTAAEQKAVSDWQSQQAEAQLAAERAKGGPRSETVSVTAKGATIRAPQSPRPRMAQAGLVPVSAAGALGFWSQPLWEGSQTKRWQGAAIGAAVVAIALGATLLVRRK